MGPITDPSGDSQSAATDAGVSIPVAITHNPPPPGGEAGIAGEPAVDTDFVAVTGRQPKTHKIDAAQLAGSGVATAGSLEAQPEPVLDTPFNGALQPMDQLGINQGSLLDQAAVDQPPADVLPLPERHLSHRRFTGLGLLTFGVVAALLLGVRVEINKSRVQDASLVSPAGRFEQQTIGLTTLNKQLAANPAAGSSVTVNGALVLAPSVQPSDPVAGQLYYSQTAHQMQYYDGTGFVALQGGVSTTNIYNSTTTVAGSTYVTNTTNSGVSLQGPAGNLAMFDSTGKALTGSAVSQSGAALATSSATILGSNASGLTLTTASSTSGPSGDVTIDVGSGVVNGTVVEDYTFEDGIDGFGGSPYSSLVAQSTTMAHSGTHSLAVPLTTSSWASAAIGNLTVIPGHEYRWTSWVRGTATTALIAAEPYFRSINVRGSDVNVTDSTGSWTQITSTFIDPAGNTSLDISYVFKKDVNDTHYIDDVTLTDLNTFTGLSVDIGATNAQAVTVGNANQAGDTTIAGGVTGIKIKDPTGMVTIDGAGVGINSSADTTITTDGATGTTGSISIQTGDSSGTAAGNVSIDTGSGLITGEVVADKTFEGGTDNMTAWFGDTVAQSNAQAHGGAESLAVTMTSQFWGISENAYNLSAPAIAGHHYFFSAWVRAATTPRTISGSICWGDITCSGTGVPLSTVTDGATGWTEMTGTAVAPGGATHALWVFDGGTGGTGDTHYFDDLEITDLSSSSSVSALNLGATNAQFVNVGNMDEIGATTIDGGSGITLNSGAGPISANGGAITISGTAASSLSTTSGSLILASGGGPGGGVIVSTQADSTSAFTVQGADGGATMLNVDTTNNAISLGIGAGNSFGYASNGNSQSSAIPAGQLKAYPYTTTMTGTLKSISVRVFSQDVAPNNQYQLAIYSDNSGNPGAYLGSTAIGTLSASVGTQWYTLPLTVPVGVTANTVYWLVYWENGNDNTLMYTAGTSTTSASSASTWQGGPDNGFPAVFPGVASGGDALHAIYATYTTSSPALTIDASGTLTQSGAALFRDPTDSTQAFQVANSLGNVLLTADTADMTIAVSGPLTVSGNITIGGEINANSNARRYNVAVAASATTLNVAFGTAYPDANYAVLCTPSFNAACFATNKTANGFTLNFGTAAPGNGSGTVDWMAIH